MIRKRRKSCTVFLPTVSLIWLILSACGDVALSAWQPPIGIPAPPFGIEETYRMYDDTNNRNPALTYHQNAEGGYYTHYIDCCDVNATDTGNPYGTVDVPRKTVPSSWTVPAGSVVEVHNGPYTTKNYFITFDGTADLPVFLRGPTDNVAGFNGCSIYFWGKYGIAENLRLDRSRLIMVVKSDLSLPEPNYVSFRNSEIGPNPGSSGININSFYGQPPNSVANLVVYNNYLHHLGDFNAIQAGEDDDKTGVVVGKFAHHIWIVDNDIYHTTGSGIVANAGSSTNMPYTHHIYIGRNTVHTIYQSGIGLKQSEDVVASGNTVYDIRTRCHADGTVGSIGKGFSWQYGPDKVWIIGNEVYDSVIGAWSGSWGGGIPDGKVYIVDNIFHDLVSDHEDLDSYGIRITDNANMVKYIVNNTICGADGGIYALRDNGGVKMSNNIIAEIDGLRHIDIDDQALSNVCDLSYTLFDETARIDWGDNHVRNVAQMQSAFGECIGCIEAEPQFVNAENNDYHLQTTSPAIDAGTSTGVVQQVFDRFEQLYGIDIRKDIEGKARTGAWDIGAYEYVLSDPNNNAPVLQPIGDKSVNEGQTLSFTIDANDPDGDSITYSAQNLPSGSELNGNAFSWTPGYNQAGVYQVTFVASDGQSSDSETISITVGNTNRSPVLAAIGDKSVNEGQTLSFAIDATDPDGDEVTYSAQDLPPGATFIVDTFSWTPGYNQAGVYQVTFVASDGQISDSEIISITVGNTNRSPVLSAIGDKSVNEGQTLNFTIDATDPDGDAVTYSAENLPSGASFTVDTFSWMPGYNQAGVYQVTFIASDGQSSDSEIISITVGNTNRSPVLAAIGDKSVNEGQTLNFTINATDPDGDAVTYSAQDLPSGATFTVDTFSWRPGYDQAGVYQVTFMASDGQGSDSETIAITINDDDPIITASAFITNPDTGNKMKVAGWDNGTLQFRDWQGNILSTRSGFDEITALDAYRSSGSPLPRLFVGSTDLNGTLRIIDPANINNDLTTRSGLGHITAIYAWADCIYVGTTDAGGTLLKLNNATLAEEAVRSGLGEITAIEDVWDGQDYLLVASTDSDGTLRMINPDTLVDAGSARSGFDRIYALATDDVDLDGTAEIVVASNDVNGTLRYIEADNLFVDKAVRSGFGTIYAVEYGLLGVAQCDGNGKASIIVARSNENGTIHIMDVDIASMSTTLDDLTVMSDFGQINSIEIADLHKTDVGVLDVFSINGGIVANHILDENLNYLNLFYW